jgi:NAD(P)H-dependent FMN reductase
MWYTPTTMEALNLTILLGTARAGRRSEAVGRFLFDAAAEVKDFIPQFVDVRDYLQSYTARVGEEGFTSASWQEVAQASDAFVFVIPEYNRGYPGEFKILIDSLGREYRRKPVLICGVSNGPWGGVRVIEHVKPVLSDVGLVVLAKGIAVPHAESFLLEDRADFRETFKQSYLKALEELNWFAKRLK